MSDESSKAPGGENGFRLYSETTSIAPDRFLIIDGVIPDPVRVRFHERFANDVTRFSNGALRVLVPFNVTAGAVGVFIVDSQDQETRVGTLLIG